MSRIQFRGPAAVWALCLLFGSVPAYAQENGAAAVSETAEKIVTFSEAPGGICSIVGADDAQLALALAKRGSFVVQCLAKTPEIRDRIRREIRAAGKYGMVSADVLSGGHLPYTNNLVNIVIVNDHTKTGENGTSVNEILRVLAPLGTAYIRVSGSKSNERSERLTERLRGAAVADLGSVESGGAWIRFHKPWPADIDEWTHFLHGADGNPVARDRVIGPPRHYQWLSDPVWMRSHETDSSISTLVTAKGRLFAIVDEAPISLAGRHALPDKWVLSARDAFNGVPLWKVPIRRWGWREWKPSWFNTRPGDVPLNIQKRLVANGDDVYATLGYYAPVSRLDAKTGKILRTYENT
ncbi:MAG: hypothetical protein JXM70_05850, partial [Pirellulales bacterium]|nr:hypothetical protein [Pirellulales bacterium]